MIAATGQQDVNTVIPVTYYTGHPNVGDLANANLISAVSGAHSYQTRDIDRPHLLAVGSTMEWSQPMSMVWGTGVMSPDRGIGKLVANNVAALRGKLSSQCLSDAGIGVDVPLGDPGYLLPALLGIERAEGKYRLGIVPHYVDKRHPFFINLAERDDCLLLDVENLDVCGFLAAMAECDAVVSSSLHGLIFAEGLGIPNLWVSVGDEIEGGGFKFRDWFSCARAPQKEAFSPHVDQGVEELLGRCRLHRCTIDRDELLRAFPREKLLTSRLARSEYGGFIDFESCRVSPMHIFIDASGDLNREELLTTLTTANHQLPSVKCVVVGPFAEQATKEFSCRFALTVVPEFEAVGSDFMKSFHAGQAEPQKHIVVECGFDFSGIDAKVDLHDALSRHGTAEAIIVDHNDRRLIFRRAGRWW